MDKVSEQLPAVATTVASLILVFLAILFTQWEGYAADEKARVRQKFRKRGWSIFFAFLSAVLSAMFGLIGIGTHHVCIWPDVVGIVFLAISIAIMITFSFISLLEI